MRLEGCGASQRVGRVAWCCPPGSFTHAAAAMLTTCTLPGLLRSTVGRLHAARFSCNSSGRRYTAAARRDAASVTLVVGVCGGRCGHKLAHTNTNAAQAMEREKTEPDENPFFCGFTTELWRRNDVLMTIHLDGPNGCSP